MRVILRFLHFELVDFLDLLLDDHPEWLEIYTHSEHHVQEVHHIYLRLLLLLLLQLLYSYLLHAWLCLWVECFSHVVLDFLVVAENLCYELFLVVTVDLTDYS